ncbi:MAG: hypothetical protein QN716_11850 [Nitrososphaeraceae archaeon]|jgi:hypothetical protein|nr:hypothetical protein [Nitrososphaeraceae archaeon]
MRYRRDVLLLIPTITAIFFITDYNVFFDSNVQAERQSQSTNTVCNGEQDSCFTTFCSNDQPCQTFPSNQLPSIVQPVEEATVTQPVEEATVTQPVEVSQEYIEATLEVCDDGQDNDVDGKVDTQDEECNATSSSAPSPIQGQSMSENQKEGEDDKQQSDNDKFERPSQEDREESGEDDEGEKDEDDNNEQQDENDDN